MPNGKEKQTHCKRGHPLSGDNLYTSKDGYRHCKTCHKITTKKWIQHRNIVWAKRQQKT